jgi:alginate O-acetyltransferase complex protein AlgI
MLFSSLTFLFAFLPLCLVLYYLAPPKARNSVLLAASILFYAWGEGPYSVVMGVSIALNWGAGLGLHALAKGRRRTAFMAAVVTANLLLLATFKYANFTVQSLNALMDLSHVGFRFALDPVHLPIGISFFTFHGLSYVVDVYRGNEEPERSPLRAALYISLFPQLVAGPIIRYVDIAQKIRDRQTDVASFVSGIERFAVGLGKKVLVANTLAQAADRCFSLKPDQLSTASAWVGLCAYTLQIYFDFSGYSDMAIGLARMFGFDFKENFRYPYVARSVTDFWRRWHISLSTWFRDYVYIPLGGNRTGPFRMYFNLWTVFLLCGLWHGSSWNFVIWGALHGALLVLERIALKKFLDRLPGAFGVLAHAYTLLMVMLAWVFFRADSLEDSGSVLKALIGLNHNSGGLPQDLFNLKLTTAFLIGVLASTPVIPWFAGRSPHTSGHALIRMGTAAFVLLTFWLSVFSLAAGTHNPFIYFRF